jgi:hypothetical protein
MQRDYRAYLEDITAAQDAENPSSKPQVPNPETGI